MISVELILSRKLSLRLESSDSLFYFKTRGSSTLSSSFISSLIYSTLIDSPQSTEFLELDLSSSKDVRLTFMNI